MTEHIGGFNVPCMIAQVKEKNCVEIPDPIASTHGIQPGTRLDWQATKEPDTLVVKVLPNFAALASSLMGAGKKYLQPNADPLAILMHDRVAEEEERNKSL